MQLYINRARIWWRKNRRWSRQNQTVILAVLAGILILSGGYYGWVRYGEGEAFAEGKDTLNTPAFLNAIVADDQMPGSRVVVKEVRLQKTSWIAVHEDREGAPGRILGVQRLPAGETVDAVVDLLRPTTSGVYYAMVHTDDGDHVFNYQRDLPLLENGSPVLVRFIVGSTDE
jgi:hypothetical protein